MRNFRIIYTSDIHGQLFSREGERTLEDMSAGFNKDGNTLILDGGDILQGSPMAAFLAYRRFVPHPAAELMNKIGYDAVTIGNHDINFGLEYLESYLKELNCACLCANVKDKAGRLPIQDMRVFTLSNGLRIGVVGVCTSVLAGWERRDTVDELDITPVPEAVLKAIGKLKGECDVTVCVYHGGYEGAQGAEEENQAELLCRITDVDLLLTGHQHVLEKGREIHGTWTVQPGSHGKFYSEIKGSVKEDGTVCFSSSLCEVPRVSSHLQPLTPLAEAEKAWENEYLCTLPKELPIKGRVEMALNGSPLADFINKVQLKVTGAQISATCLSNIAKGLPARVLRKDAYRCYTSANSLCVVAITGEKLKEALEWTACFLEFKDGNFKVSDRFLVTKKRLFHYDFYYGIDYQIDFTRPEGDRVTKLRFNGKDVLPNDLFSMCVTSYRRAGGDGYSMFRTCPLLSADSTLVVEHIIQALKAWDVGCFV